ncbi:MAG: hypothetical protein H0X38_16335, partial [Planctomycetes bacterium]|nr:hypothetical protein [Planctomycetota bacterium]
MGDVYGEFERTLAQWRSRYAGRPEAERWRLLFLALEREQLVSVAYREDVILARLAQMPLPDEVRRLIHH